MRIPLLLAAIALPCSANAQPADPAPPTEAQSRDRLTIGLGGGIAPSYDGSDDYRFQPGGIVQGQVDGYEFAMRGLNVFVDLARESPEAATTFALGPVVQYQTNRGGGIKDRRVRALGTISETVEIGGYAGIGRRAVLNRFDQLSVDVAFLHDVGGVHNSFTVTPTVNYFTPLSPKTFALLGLSAEYAGKGFGRTYFDVTPAGSAASGLAAFRVRDAGFTSASTTLLLGRALGPDPRKGWSLFALGSYSRMLGDYAQSPIVRDAGSRNQWFGVAGVAYSF